MAEIQSLKSKENRLRLSYNVLEKAKYCTSVYLKLHHLFDNQNPAYKKLKLKKGFVPGIVVRKYGVDRLIRLLHKMYMQIMYFAIADVLKGNVVMFSKNYSLYRKDWGPSVFIVASKGKRNVTITIDNVTFNKHAYEPQERRVKYVKNYYLRMWNLFPEVDEAYLKWLCTSYSHKVLQYIISDHFIHAGPYIITDLKGKREDFVIFSHNLEFIKYSDLRFFNCLYRTKNLKFKINEKKRAKRISKRPVNGLNPSNSVQ